MLAIQCRQLVVTCSNCSVVEKQPVTEPNSRAQQLPHIRGNVRNLVLPLCLCQPQMFNQRGNRVAETIIHDAAEPPFELLGPLNKHSACERYDQAQPPSDTSS